MKAYVILVGGRNDYGEWIQKVYEVFEGTERDTNLRVVYLNETKHLRPKIPQHYNYTRTEKRVRHNTNIMRD